jgi:hypothetical protein
LQARNDAELARRKRSKPGKGAEQKERDRERAQKR